MLVPLLAAWFGPYLAIGFDQPLGNTLELVDDFVLIPALAGVLLISLAGCRPSGHLDTAAMTVA